jgi:hypothetical protein
MIHGIAMSFARGLVPACALCCLVALGLLEHRAIAQNRNWAPIPVDTNWLNGDNWIPQGVPTSAETVLITHSGTFDVMLSESQTVGGLRLGGAQGAQTLTVDGGAILTVEPGVDNVQVQGTGILVLDGASMVGAVENHATIRLQEASISSLTLNSGLLEAVDSENSIPARPLVNPKLGTIRVRAETAAASLTYGNPEQPLPLGNAGRIELVSTGGHAARLDLVGPSLTVLETGVLSLSGDAGACVLDVGAVNNAGRFGGHGELTGDLLNDAEVYVGAGPGTLKIGGLYTQSSMASLEIEIAGPAAGSQYDVLDVATTADLDGLLIVDVLGGFVPGGSDEFTILRRAGGNGEFGTVQVSGLAEHGYTMRYEGNAVIMEFLSGDEILTGDFNGNAQVEQGDLDLVLLNWGSEGRTPLGWTNDLPDGTIDQNELDRVLLHWGDAAAGLSAGGVPEPSTWAMLLLAAASVPFIRRRRPARRR